VPSSQDRATTDEVDHDTTPPASAGLLALAGVLLLLPIVALMWVGSYAKVDPRLGPFPFFVWYQLVWVFVCSGCTYTAYRVVVRARPHRPMTNGPTHDEKAHR
jgi:hypothetical protein